MIDYRLLWVDEATVTTDLVREFLAQQHRERLLAESTTVELKTERNRFNVVEAVCGLANTHGGVVLVGVDERAPTRLPGVLPQERDALVGQCLAVLEPGWAPDVVAVRADDPDRVVLVVRVDPADRPAPPVLCQGRAYVRAPGRTVRATRDQVLTLVAAGSAETGTGGALGGVAVASSYFPSARTGGPDDAQVPDLRLRAATGLWLRGPAAGVVVTTPMRAALTAAFDSSDAAAWAAGHLPPDEHPRWTPTVARLAWWEATRPLPRRWKPDVTLCVHARSHGSHVALVADIEIRDSDYAAAADGVDPDTAQPILSIDDLADGFLRLLVLAGVDLPQAAAAHLPLPPIRADAVTVWGIAARHDLHRLAGVAKLRHDGSDHVTAAQHTAAVADLAAARAATLDWLQRMLLEDGVADGEGEAARIVAALPDRARPRPWL